VRFLRRVLLVLAVLPLLAVGGVGLWLYSSLPVTDGRLVLPGLEREVRVTRDGHGIPTVIAQNQHDADFAVGFLHAQDRLFAMDMMRRYGAGRLAELYGARFVQIDRGIRMLGLYRAAERQYAGLAVPTRAALDAYAAGVNAFIATRRGAWPPEYYLLRSAPEPWRPADSLVWAKIMDLQLTGNYRGELLRARMLRHLSPADLAVLYPAYPKDAPVTLDKARAAYRDLPLDKLFAALPPGGPQAASNNWVLSGAHTESRKALLANDPHLDFSAPGVWYLIRIETPDLKLAGVTAPGNPFLIIGHNEHIAWGFTTTGSDVEDLFVEKPDPVDHGRYEAPGGSLPFTTRQEEIRVRDGAPVPMTIRETRHGPVISDLIAGSELMALSATWLAADDHSPDAVWAMSRAQDWQGFRHALESWTAPQQNIVYADTEGNIGFIAPARIPIRAKGDGWLPVPGWTGDYDWTDWVPFDALPMVYNPPDGRIVTANNKIVPDDYRYLLTHDWELPYRAERINALLDARALQTPETTAAIQGDVLSLTAKQLLPIMLKVTPASVSARLAVERLRRWDGRMDRTKGEPLIFIAWLRELNRVLLSDKLGGEFRDFWGLRPNVVQNILSEHQDWCDHGDCTAALATALERALADLQLRYGAAMDDWRWGRAHPASFESAFWSHVPLASALVDLALPDDGDQDTVNAAAMFVGDPKAPFVARHGPSLRMIVDLGAPDAARFMITPGQSGNPLSLHWGDLMRPWRDVEYLTFTDDASGGVLTLVPK
jgi:penicillin G amidase